MSSIAKATSTDLLSGGVGRRQRIFQAIVFGFLGLMALSIAIPAVLIVYFVAAKGAPGTPPSSWPPPPPPRPWGSKGGGGGGRRITSPLADNRATRCSPSEPLAGRSTHPPDSSKQWATPKT